MVTVQFDLPAGYSRRGWLESGMRLESLPEQNMLAVNGVPGFLFPGDIREIWNFAGCVPAGRPYLEVGSWLGLSASIAATSMRANGNEMSRVHCVDTWQPADGLREAGNVGDSDIFSSFNENLRSADVAGMVEAHRGESLDVAAQLANTAFHTIFIDGDHSLEGAYADLVAWHPLLEKNGRMFGHDAVPDGGVRAALIKFATERGLDWRIIEPPDAYYIWEIFPSESPSSILDPAARLLQESLLSVRWPDLSPGRDESRQQAAKS